MCSNYCLCWVVILLMAPGLLRAQQRKEADELIGEAKAATEKGDHKRAIKNYTDAMSRLYFLRAGVHAEEGDIDEAIADYTDSIRLNSKAAMSYYGRGILHGKKDNFDKAIADYNQAIRLEPAYMPAYVNRAASYEQKGDYEKAVADLRKALELDPEHPYPNYNLAWLLATCPKKEVRDGRKALELARKACEPDGWKKNPWCLDTLAAAYAETGDFKEAAKLAKEAVQSANGLSKEQVKSMEERLKLYEQEKPYREKPPARTGKRGHSGFFSKEENGDIQGFCGLFLGKRKRGHPGLLRTLPWKRTLNVPVFPGKCRTA